MDSKQKKELDAKVAHLVEGNEKLEQLKAAEKLLEAELEKTARAVTKIMMQGKPDIPGPQLFEVGGKTYLLEHVSQMFWDLITRRKNIIIRLLKK